MDKDSIDALICGYEVIACDSCADWVQARRHRKKRINKKWRKRYGMRAVPWRQIIIVKGNQKIIGHPSVINGLMAEIEKRGVNAG